jgi:hypothetical protein
MPNDGLVSRDDVFVELSDIVDSVTQLTARYPYTLRSFFYSALNLICA